MPASPKQTVTEPLQKLKKTPSATANATWNKMLEICGLFVGLCPNDVQKRSVLDYWRTMELNSGYFQSNIALTFITTQPHTSGLRCFLVSDNDALNHKFNSDLLKVICLFVNFGKMSYSNILKQHSLALCFSWSWSQCCASKAAKSEVPP